MSMHAFGSRQRLRASVVASAVAGGVALAMVVPSAANAADVVSRAQGRLVDTTLLTTQILDAVAELKGAVAVNADATGDVVADTPLNASVLSGVAGVSFGPTNLFGNNGIIQLGAVGQYAKANDDGSSLAFAGTVSNASSLLGVGTGTVTSSDFGTSDPGAKIGIGTGSSPVSLNATIGALAAAASQDTAGAQQGDYVLANADVVLGGTVLGTTLGTLNPALNTLLAAASVAGLNIANPFSSGTVQVSLTDLLAVAGVSNVNDLPAGTNLVQYLPTAVANKLTSTVNGVLAQVQARVTQLGLAGLVLGTALSTATAVINPLLSGLPSALVTPLGTALGELVQLNVNVQRNGSDGSFTQTALQVGLLSSGALTTVDLASASVGPNAGLLAVPVAGPESAMIAGGVLVGLVAIAMPVLLIRRRGAAAAGARV